jgi:hypothetical protein
MAVLCLGLMHPHEKGFLRLYVLCPIEGNKSARSFVQIDEKIVELTCMCRVCCVPDKSSSPSGSPPGCSGLTCAPRPVGIKAQRHKICISVAERAMSQESFSFHNIL